MIKTKEPDASRRVLVLRDRSIVDFFDFFFDHVAVGCIQFVLVFHSRGFKFHLIIWCSISVPIWQALSRVKTSVLTAEWRSKWSITPITDGRSTANKRAKGSGCSYEVARKAVRKSRLWFALAWIVSFWPWSWARTRCGLHVRWRARLTRQNNGERIVKKAESRIARFRFWICANICSSP